MKIASFPGMFALRYPFFAPEDDLGGGEDLDPAFVEQPGDREPDPDAGDPDPAPDADADPAPDADADADPDADPAPDTDPDPVAADADTDPDAEDDPAPKKKDWRDRQIIKARAAEKAEREARQAADAEIARLKALVEADPDKAKAAEIDPDKIRAEVETKIRQEQRVQSINERCDAMFDAGAKAFPKTWEERVKDAGEIFGEEMRGRPDFLEAVTDLDNAAAVYHDLASDPDRMETVLNLPPHKMGMELARISAKLSIAPKPKAISKAPPPIKPLDGPTLQERSLEDLANDPSPAAMREFDKRMTAEENKRAQVR